MSTPNEITDEICAQTYLLLETMSAPFVKGLAAEVISRAADVCSSLCEDDDGFPLPDVPVVREQAVSYAESLAEEFKSRLIKQIREQPFSVKVNVKASVLIA